MRAWRGSWAWGFVWAAVVVAASCVANSETGSSVSIQHIPETVAGFSSDNLSVPVAQSTDRVAPGFSLEEPEGVAAYCGGLARGKAQGAALESVCEFSLSLRWKLPNVICDQETSRYQEGMEGEVVDRDTIKAKVRYEGGREQYSQITQDGKAVKSAVLDSSGAWSEGEFATGLRTIFLPRTAAEFTFVKQDALRGTPVLIFDFRVERKNNLSWYLKASSGETTFPGYRGRLWINKSNLKLVRLERRVAEIAADFPIQQVNTVIDYGDVDLADGTSFVLPIHALNLTCPTFAPIHCGHNELTFKHWQKFAARARVLTGEETPPAPVSGVAPVASAAPPANVAVAEVDSLSVSMDVRRGAGVMTEILNERIAVVAERQRQVEIAAASPVEATKAAPKTESPVTAAANAGTALPGDQLLTLKSSVRLVLVPAVVRDSQGHAVDYLQKPDFRLLDDRKPQLITQFSLERPGNVVAAPAESGVASGVQGAGTAGVRFAAYVFDDIHATYDDLGRARDAAKRHLTALQAGDRAAVFTLSGNIALDFTDDRAKVSDALLHIRPHPLTATGLVRCPDISYAQADLIQNNDSAALAQATDEAMQCAFSGDPTARVPAERLARETAAQVLIAGRAESERSFNALQEVVRRISRMPGQRSIVLVSPGFPVAEMEQEATEIIDDAQRAEVIINVLDPSGLSTKSGIEYGGVSGPWDVLADLTSGTGGTFYRNRNDVDEGFQRTALPELFYILGFAPQKLDGRFHSLKVILQRPEKLNLQARRGYYALKTD
jgi:VWFA-related protein